MACLLELHAMPLFHIAVMQCMPTHLAVRVIIKHSSYKALAQ